MTDNRRKIVAVALVSVVLIGLGLGYMLYATNRVGDDLSDREERALDSVRAFEQSVTPPPRPTRAPEPTATPDPDAPTYPIAEPGEVVVINRVPGDDYGRMAIRHVDGTRTLLDRRCLRLYVAAGNGVCLSQQDALVPQYTATLFDAADPYQRDIKSYPMALPSRARITPDGATLSATGFVSGSSYTDIGGATATIVFIDSFASNELVSLSEFDIDSDDPKYAMEAADFWGTTFVDNDNFYVTGLFGADPEVMAGSLSTATLRPTTFKGSCPSVSPDGETLVYKRTRDGGGYDLVAVTLATGDNWVLNETRSADDQVEWLDDDTILYALHPVDDDASVQPEWDIWALDITPGSEPQMFLPNADSPAVIRALPGA